MDYTYLKLLGWIALHLEMDGEKVQFMYNPHKGLIVNRRGILRNEYMTLNDECMNNGLRIATYNEVPFNIIKQVIELSKEYG